MRLRLLTRAVSVAFLLTFASSLAYATVEFAATSSSGPESSTPALLTVNVAPTPTSAPVTVDYAVTGGTATGGGVDYTLASGTLNFAIGVGSQDISVTVVDDALDETDETVIVTLSNPTGDSLGANTQHTYTINDDDPTPTVEFDLTSSNGSEATTPADLAVSLSTASGLTVTVDYAVTGGTATGGGVDYTLAAGTLTFLPSETTHNVSATIVDDAIDEADETIIVTLSNPTNASLGANTAHTYTINDDDPTPTVEFDLTSSNASEATTPADLAVSLSAASGQTVTVDYAVTGGTATGGGVDYTLAAGTLTFLPGETTHNVSAAIVDDAIDEADETIIVTLSNPTNATLGANTVHTYTINDDDPAPTVEFDSPSSSGLEFVTAVSLPVSLSVASGQTVTVDYAVTGGTATGGGVDYTLTAGTLTFLPGATTENIPVTITDDALSESSETIIVTLSNPANASLGATTDHTYTIFDDESANFVEFALPSSNGPESTAGVSLTVNLSPSSTNTVTVDYAVTGGTATGGGVDYTLTPGTLTFLPGETTHTIPATVVDDALSEADETIIVTLSNPTNAFIGTNGSHTYTINDDDAAPSLQFDLVSSSGLESSTPADLAVSLSGASGQTVTVDYAVTGGTATGGGVDYTLVPGTLTFLPGETTKNVSITIVDDLLDEADESIIVTLSNPTNVTLGARTQHTYVIIDDDPPGAFTVQFDSSASSGSEALTPANLAVSLSGTSGVTVTVDYAAVGGTATDPDDYSLAPGTLTFLPGETTKNIPVTINDDAVDEADETVIVALSNPTNAVLGANSQHTYTIIDNDPPPTVEFFAPSSGGFEFVTPALLSVSLSASSSQTVSVDYAVTGGTATDPDDFSLPAGTLTFLPGETMKNISATIVDDALTEPDETIIVGLSNPVNSILGVTDEHTYTISDDEGETFFQFALSSSSGAESVTTVLLTVNASPTPTAVATVDYAATGGTATVGGVDYTLAPGTLTFLAGEATKDISVTVVDDLSFEDDETIIVTLSNPTGAFLKPPTDHTYTITDDDAEPTVGFASPTSAGPENVTPALLTVNVLPTPGVTVTVDYAVTGGTATDPDDFSLAADTLTFLPGESSKDISVTIVDDVIYEGDETVVVTLSNPTNAVLGTAVTTHTIEEDEVMLTVGFSSPASSGGEPVTPALITVNVSPTPTAAPVTVDYAVTGGTAVSPEDYSLTPDTLTFAIGEASKDISVTIVDDPWAETDETIVIGLSNPTNSVLGQSSHTYTILNDDPTPVGFVNDVESGTAGWGATGLWHIVDTATDPYPEAYSPTHSWWYGRDATGNYDTGAANAGDLISPHIEFPVDGTLAFWSFEQTEANENYDTKKAYVWTDSGGTWDLVYQSLGSPKLAWHQSAVDLAAYAGEQGFVKFEFDTTDRWYNAYRGWYLDDMVLAFIPPTPIPALVDDMESGDDKWNATGLWHIVDSSTNPYGEAASGTHSWWYGLDATGTYNTGAANTGRLESRPFPLPPGTELWFMTWEEVEPTFDAPSGPFDLRRVWISTDGGSTWDPTPLYQSNVAATTGWELVTVDISAYSSPNAMIAFEFDTVDDLFNDYRGWYVDDVSVAPNGFDEDMEAGITDWEADGLWHLVDTGATPTPDPYANANSPTRSWWYGQPSTGNYNTGAPNSGTLDSSVFRVPADQNLAFFSWEQVEAQAAFTYDLRQVLVSDDGGDSWSLFYTSDGAVQDAWHLVLLDFSSYAGKAVRLRFKFDTVDALYNNYRGWYVDDVQLVTGMPPVLSDDFESGAPGWAATGFWHIVESGVDTYGDAHSPTHSWWYGQDLTGDYDNGATNYGSLFSPEFNLPAAATLNFWNWEETENVAGFDLIRIHLWLDGGAEFHTIYVSDGTQQRAWFDVTVDLSAYTSPQAQLEFEFDTVDPIANYYRGWYVDDVTVGE